MTCYVITESSTDALLLHWLLQPEVERYSEMIQIRGVASRARVGPVAQTLILSRGAPVACVVSAHSTDPEVLEERKIYLTSDLERVSPSHRYALLFFIPTAEAVLFHDEALLQHVFGRPLTEVERVRAEYDPRRVLAELMAEKQLSLEQVWQRITTHSPALARTAPPIPQLLDFVHRVLSPEFAAVSS